MGAGWPDAFFTPEEQRERIEGLLRQRDEVSVVPWVFEEENGRRGWHTVSRPVPAS
ncbi:hypothetical protein [Streptomyces pluripotens]|uniref:hypothetical protein n=1 Tax=Streptomyces pluripotens TaxID=1355015 RepID=UPI000AF95724|nr:hypothetical protein [Streptomyces pluripotens]